MFDFHMHSRVSYDGRSSAMEMALAASQKGLKTICFTDHRDYDPLNPGHKLTFDKKDYEDAYDALRIPGLEICKGFEFGLLPDNQKTLEKDMKCSTFDFVIGSVHFVDGLDVYYPAFWENRTVEDAELRFMEMTLENVKRHNGFDVLGHLTYISKTTANPYMRPIPLGKYRELTDEIFKILAQKGKGIEINTSGVDRCGAFLPDESYLRRFKELGGEIVTVGSDAHEAGRVGQYCGEACRIVQDIFGYVCTFRERKPVFHKI